MQLYNITDVANLLRCSNATVYQMIYSGSLKAYQIKVRGEGQERGGWRIHSDDLREFMKTHIARPEDYAQASKRREYKKEWVRKKRDTNRPALYLVGNELNALRAALTEVIARLAPDIELAEQQNLSMLFERAADKFRTPEGETPEGETPATPDADPTS